MPNLPNFSKIKNPLSVLKFKFFKFYFILEYFDFKLSTCSGQSDVFGIESKSFSTIRQIRLFRQGISENLDCVPKTLCLNCLENRIIETVSLQ